MRAPPPALAVLTSGGHIVAAMDRIRETSAATRRCFVVETMGGYCGYLP